MQSLVNLTIMWRDFGDVPKCFGMSTSISDTITELAKLETLHIRGHVLGSLPDRLGNLRSLKHLTLHDTSDKPGYRLYGVVPESIWSIEGLETFKLVSTSISGFARSNTPYSFPPSLVEFNVRDSTNFLADLGQVLAKAPNLRILDLRNSTIISDNMRFLANSPNLTEFYLGSSRIGDGFEGRWPWPKLEVADLGSSTAQLSIASLYELTNLRALFAQGNLVGSMPTRLEPLQKLEVLELQDVHISGSLPSDLGHLKNLRHLTLTTKGMLQSTIPETIGDLTILEHLDLSLNTLEGTIPFSINKLRNLRYLDLSKGRLVGTVPDFDIEGLHVNLAYNELTGTIPPRLARSAGALLLSNNELGPDLNQTIFAENLFLSALDLKTNQFHASLPILPPNVKIALFCFNSFVGSVPRSFCQVPELSLDNNHLNGSIVELLTRCPVSILRLHNNEFRGPIPDISQNVNLRMLDISFNHFEGPLPLLPPTLLRFSVTNNDITGPLTKEFIDSVQQSNVLVLDLSRNQLSCPDPQYDLTRLFYSRLRFLSLADNQFACQLLAASGVKSPATPPGVPPPAFHAPVSALAHAKMDGNMISSIIASVGHGLDQDVRLAVQRTSHTLDLGTRGLAGEKAALATEFNTLQMIGLDLSSNQFTGNFYPGVWPSLISLKLGFNRFNGRFLPNGLANFPIITNLDIAYNGFSFEAAEITDLPYLRILNIESNAVFGTLTLIELHSLQMADYSRNRITGFDFQTIRRHFTQRTLNSLTFSKQLITEVSKQDFSTSGLVRTTSSSPAKTRNGTVCYALVFEDSVRPSDSVTFDEALFNYAQCDCDAMNYGLPSTGCTECPVDGIAACGAEALHVSPNWFGSSLKTSNDSSEAIETESCIVTTAQEITQSTNCQGFNYSAAHPGSLPTLIANQCIRGSEGRLCSRCQCNASDCYFWKAATCHRCNYVATTDRSVAFLVGTMLGLVLVLTVIMFFVLRSKRTRSTLKWSQLSLLKRIFYRAHYLTSLGNVTILITFIQLWSELTHWDSYVLKGLISVLNGSGEGLGIVCLLPFLSSPMLDLLAKLILPLLGIALVGTSILLAEVLTRISTSILRKKRNAISLTDARLDDGWTSLLIDETSEFYQPYPSVALFTSMSITVFRFFYFSSAIAAHTYFFYDVQRYTGKKFSRNQPWMEYRDATPLNAVSIPAVILFDFALPFCFLVLCWKVRRTFATQSVQIYFGSLFETFSRRCFWWEIVNILRKLVIALILQGLSPLSAIQSTLIFTVLLVIMMAQVAVSPWKRKTENFAETISMVLLIGSLHAARSELSDSRSMMYLIGALDAAFALGSIGIIAWHTITGRTDYQKQQDALKGSVFEKDTLLASHRSLNADSDGDETQGDDFSVLKSELFSESELSE